MDYYDYVSYHNPTGENFYDQKNPFLYDPYELVFFKNQLQNKKKSKLLKKQITRKLSKKLSTEKIKKK